MPNMEGNPGQNGLHKLCETHQLAEETIVPIHSRDPKRAGTTGISLQSHLVQTLAVAEEGSA